MLSLQTFNEKKFLSEGRVSLKYPENQESDLSDEVERKLDNMRVRTYLLVAFITVTFMSFNTKMAKPTTGLNPGDRAPRIEFLGTENNFSFQNHSGCYTLLNFWAAYDAESRAQNVRLMNEITKVSSDKLLVKSISFDQNESVFKGTIKSDKLDLTTQFQEKQGAASKLWSTYRLDRGFSNYLIDDKGVIVASNITPTKLAELLKAI